MPHYFIIKGMKLNKSGISSSCRTIMGKVFPEISISAADGSHEVGILTTSSEMLRIQCLLFDGIFIAATMRAAWVYNVFCCILEEDISNSLQKQYFGELSFKTSIYSD
jgi:hypothetical protein